MPKYADNTSPLYKVVASPVHKSYENHDVVFSLI